MKNFKKKTLIMGRTGNSGPPDTNLEQSLRYNVVLCISNHPTNWLIVRTIITIDQSPSEATRTTRPGRRTTRPFISDPQPISTNAASVSRYRMCENGYLKRYFEPGADLLSLLVKGLRLHLSWVLTILEHTDRKEPDWPMKELTLEKR